MGTSCSKGVKTTPETHDLHTMVMRWGFEPLSRYLGTPHTRGVRSIPGTINYIPFGAPRQKQQEYIWLWGSNPIRGWTYGHS